MKGRTDYFGEWLDAAVKLEMLKCSKKLDTGTPMLFLAARQALDLAKSNVARFTSEAEFAAVERDIESQIIPELKRRRTLG